MSKVADIKDRLKEIRHHLDEAESYCIMIEGISQLGLDPSSYEALEFDYRVSVCNSLQQVRTLTDDIVTKHPELWNSKQ